jgi:tetratricopeptide (TPR) repeat protein
MSRQNIRLVIVACAVALLSAAEFAQQTRLKGRVHTPGDDPFVARELVTIEGAGQYTTDDHGEFEFDLGGDLRVGGEARFHVYHVNPAIRIQQWIVIRPCDNENGRMLSLPAVGSRPISIVVLSKGDQRLKSLNKDYSILECIIEGGASEFKPRSGGPDRSSLSGDGTSVMTSRVDNGCLYENRITRCLPTLVDAVYRVPPQEKSSDSPSGDVRSSPLLDQASLTKKAAELGFTPPELADALDAWVRSAESSYQKGLAALYKRRYAEASEYISASIPSPPGEFLKRYVPLARAEYEQGHYSAAEAALRKVLAVHSDDPLILNNLGVVLSDEAKYTEVEALYKRALTIDEKALGPDHSDVARDLNNLAELYRAQGKYTEAEPLYRRALMIDEKALGPDHPAVAIRQNNLAVLYHSQGKYAKAEPLYNRALAIDEKALGPDHPDVARDLNNQAELYRERGKYTEAEPLYKRALAIAEKALGPDHQSVAIVAENLAADLRKLGRDAEAKFYEEQAARIRASKKK